MYLLSIIIPVFNEEKTILELLHKITSIPELSTSDTQYIIINDGSTDNTNYKLKTSNYIHDSRFTFLNHEKNKGKGAAILTGLSKATGKYTVIQDGDLEYNPQNIPPLLEHVKKNALRVVYGSRNLNKKNLRGKFWFYWGGIFLSFLTNILYRQKITDEATGYKLFETKLLQSLPLTCTKFEFCPEVTALLSKQGIKITELPIDYNPRGKKEGKKINFWDGASAVWTLLRLRFQINNKYLLASAISIFILACYFFTWGGYFMGYEEETAKTAIALFEGRYEIKRAGFGATLLYVPFVLFGKIFLPSKLDRLLTIVPLVYSAFTAGIIFLCLEKIKIKRSIAIFSTIIIGLGTLIWPYSKIGMEYQAMFIISLLLLSLVNWKNKIEQSPHTFPLTSAFLLALLTITKSYGIIFILPTLLFIAQSLYEQNNVKKIFQLKYISKLLIPSVLFLTITIGLNLFIYHRISGAYKLQNEFQIWHWWDGFWGIFFSFGKSIFIYNPLLIIAVFYFSNFYKKYQALSLFIGSGFLVLLFITAPFSYWSDETLSVRKLVPMIPFLHFPLVLLVEKIYTSKITKIILYFFIIISFYIQFINASYSYWNQLPFLRKGNLDSLQTMRYTPELSHIYLHHRFFSSYLFHHLTRHPQIFTYEEKSWMRCCFPPKSADITLSKISIDLTDFEKPNIFILRSTTFYKKLLLLFNNITWVTCIGFILLANMNSYRRLEKSSSPSTLV